MTEIFYFDLSATSAHGTCRLSAVAPPDEPARFRYTCRRQVDGVVVWRREPAPDEDPPMQVFVSEDAWAVIRTHTQRSAGLLVVSPRGELVGAVDLVAQVFEARDLAAHVAFTSAGPFWSDGAIFRFLPGVGPAGAFTVRTAGRVTFGLDLATATLLPPGPWEDRLREEEGVWALETLRAGVAALASWPVDEPALAVYDALEPDAVSGWEADDDVDDDERVGTELGPDEVRAAAIAAGHLGLAEAIPLLCKLERVSGGSSSSTCVALNAGHEFPGPWCVTTRSFRQTIQVSLRRLGATPPGRAAYRFDVARGHEVDVPELLTDREARAGGVRVGSPAREVLSLLGCPDHMDDAFDRQAGFRREWWDYDLRDGEGLHTLRLTFDRGGAVGTIERVRPPAWWDGAVAGQEL